MRKRAKVRNARSWALLRIKDSLFDGAAQKLLAFDIAPVENRTRTNERGRGDNQSRGADKANPFEVGQNVRIQLCGMRHDFQLVSGQR